MESGNRLMIANILDKFKHKGGLVDYVMLGAIPPTDRLPYLAETDLPRAVALITIALTMAFENINVKNGMTNDQIVNLAEEIINSASEDDLAVQDVTLFLQGLVRGKFGKLYESLDVPKFMQFFEEYRNERYRTVMEWKENKHEEYKNLGDREVQGLKTSALDQHLSEFTTKLQARNDEIKELREERKRRHQQDNF